MFPLNSLYRNPRCAYCDDVVDADDLLWNENTPSGGACPECLAEIEEDLY